MAGQDTALDRDDTPAELMTQPSMATVYLNQSRCREAGLDYWAPRGAVVAIKDPEAFRAVLRQRVPGPQDTKWAETRVVRSAGYGWWSLAARA